MESQNLKSGVKWSKCEENALNELVDNFGKDWDRIARDSRLSKRTALMCKNRHEILSSGMVAGHWTQEEDNIILNCMLREKLTKWSDVARRVENRTGKQCRERWANHLDPTLKKTPWTDQEDQLLLALQSKLGNFWTKIALKKSGQYTEYPRTAGAKQLGFNQSTGSNFNNDLNHYSNPMSSRQEEVEFAFKEKKGRISGLLRHPETKVPPVASKFVLITLEKDDMLSLKSAWVFLTRSLPNSTENQIYPSSSFLNREPLSFTNTSKEESMLWSSLKDPFTISGDTSSAASSPISFIDGLSAVNSPNWLLSVPSSPMQPARSDGDDSM